MPRKICGFTEMEADIYLREHGWKYWHPNCGPACGYQDPETYRVGYAWGSAIISQKEREKPEQLSFLRIL
jgi:hypothetical protein